MLSVKQGDIKYHFFLVFGINSTWDWTPVSRPLENTLLITVSGAYRFIRCTFLLVDHFVIKFWIFGEEARRQLHKNATSNIE